MTTVISEFFGGSGVFDGEGDDEDLDGRNKLD